MSRVGHTKVYESDLSVVCKNLKNYSAECQHLSFVCKFRLYCSSDYTQQSGAGGPFDKIIMTQSVVFSVSGLIAGYLLTTSDKYGRSFLLKLSVAGMLLGFSLIGFMDYFFTCMMVVSFSLGFLTAAYLLGHLILNETLRKSSQTNNRFFFLQKIR